MVLGQAAIADVVSPRERGKYQGYLAAAFGSATVAGPLVGGFFTDHLAWRWAFSVNMPFGIGADRDEHRPSRRRGRERPVVDYFGAVLLTPAIAGVVLLTSWGGNRYSWGSPVILGIIAGTVVLVTAFIAVERRTAEPLLPPRLFKVSVVSFSASVSFLYGVALFGVITFLPLFLQLVSGTSATGSGLVMAPMLVSLSIASAVAGRFISQIGRYKAFPVIGTATTAVALFLLSTMEPDTTHVTTAIYMVLLGVGFGLIMQVLLVATQNAVPVDDLGAATASISFFRSIGSAVGVALFGTVFASSLTRQPTLPGKVPSSDIESHSVASIADAFGPVFLYASVAMLLAFTLAWFVRELPLRSGTAAADTEPADPLPDDVKPRPLPWPPGA